MKLKNSRSTFYLFAAMVVSSVVIGGYCKTNFVAVSDTSATVIPLSTLATPSNKSEHADVDIMLGFVDDIDKGID